MLEPEKQKKRIFGKNGDNFSFIRRRTGFGGVLKRFAFQKHLKISLNILLTWQIWKRNQSAWVT